MSNYGGSIVSVRPATEEDFAQDKAKREWYKQLVIRPNYDSEYGSSDGVECDGCDREFQRRDDIFEKYPELIQEHFDHRARGWFVIKPEEYESLVFEKIGISLLDLYPHGIRVQIDKDGKVKRFGPVTDSKADHSHFATESVFHIRKPTI